MNQYNIEGGDSERVYYIFHVEAEFGIRSYVTEKLMYLRLMGR